MNLTPLTSKRWMVPLMFIATVLSGCAGDNSPGTRGWEPGPSISLLDPAPQEVDERSYRTMRATEDLRIGGDDENLNVYNPIDVIVDDEGHIYVLDEGSYQVKKFDPEGRLLRTYGEGYGQGPGELVSPIDFDVRESGEVLVLDRGARSVVRFAADGSFLHQHPLSGQPLQLIATEEEHLVFLASREDLFTVFDDGGSELRSFGRFMEHQTRKSVAVHGTVTLERDILYYIGFWSGHIVATTLDGEVLYATKSIDGLELPGFHYSERLGSTTLDTEGYPVHPMLAVVDDLLYATTLFAEEERLVLDAYDASNGLYQFSTEWDIPCGPAEVTERHIYTLCNGQVARYMYDIESAE